MIDTLKFWLEKMMTVEFWVQALSAFKDLGPVAPILLALVESLVPALAAGCDCDDQHQRAWGFAGISVFLDRNYAGIAARLSAVSARS